MAGPPPPSRRSVLQAAAAVAGAGVAAWLDDPLGLVARAAGQAATCSAAADPGELVAVLPVVGTRPEPTPYGRLVGGSGLDARQFTDLSGLAPDRLVTPADQVFIRTAHPPQLEGRSGPWAIQLQGRPPAAATRLDTRALADQARPMGAHLIECAGNTDPQNFGLMSVAEWDGVPVTALLPRFGTGPAATALLVSGVDQTTPSWRSQPGASWVLPLDALARQGAFLAVRMNGAPLTLDHGAPVRLVVPGWYACAWIKWVDTLRLVGPDEPATSQMREFAERTHQDGEPALARDFEPPAIDVAATPVRVEKRRVQGRLRYRVVGIVWGGERPVDRLQIRFGARDPYKPFALCPAPATATTWSVWEYWWDPGEPGPYDIALAAADPAIRTRRLDLSWYLRRVRIDEV